jgi:hypothetical protein
MAITTLSRQAFCLAIGSATSATRDGPVIMLDDDGSPAHVQLSFKEYRRMGGRLEEAVVDEGAELTGLDEAASRSAIDASPWAFMLEALNAICRDRRRRLMPESTSLDRLD